MHLHILKHECSCSMQTAVRFITELIILMFLFQYCSIWEQKEDEYILWESLVLIKLHN
jgi:hypothetical protein